MKIITTVGTSLITNSETNCDSLKELVFSFDYFDNSKTNNTRKKISDKEQELFRYLEDGTCAELASVKEIDPKGEAEIFLICTETVLSYMCGRVIQQKIGQRAKVEFISGLQVERINEFKREGVPSLLNHIEKIAQNGNYWDDIVLNVTGGYKALIPIMTVIGQVKGLPIYYIFKGDVDKKYQLISIPKMPISFDINVFEEFFDSFVHFGLTGNEIIDQSSLLSSFLGRCEGFIEIADNLVGLNPIGKILWWNYREKYFLFKTDNSTWNEIQKQEDISRILSSKFWNEDLRNRKTEKKQNHYVFDDGNNNNRIYYFSQNEELYIYKTFENEEKAKAYIDTDFNQTSKNQFIRNSKVFRIKKS